MAWTKYSTTAASNNAAAPNGAPENMAPSTVNDTMRDMMAEIRLLGDQARGPLHLLTSVSGADTIVGTATPAIAAYAAGQRFVFVSAGANTGAVTLNVNGVGAVALKKGAASAALAAADIPSGALVEVVYLTSPSTQFRIASIGGSVADLPPTLASLEGLSLAAGDLLYATAADTLARLPKGTAGYRLQIGASAPSWVPDTFGGQLLHLQDQKVAGTDGGGATSGSFATRVLNTEVTDEIGSTLASNQFTLPAGTYWCEAEAPGVEVDKFVAKLRNVTDSTDTLVGSPGYSANVGTLATSFSHIRGRFTLAGTKTLAVQMRVNNTRSGYGLGIAANMGLTEIFTDLRIWKVA